MTATIESKNAVIRQQNTVVANLDGQLAVLSDNKTGTKTTCLNLVRVELRVGCEKRNLKQSLNVLDQT